MTSAFINSRFQVVIIILALVFGFAACSPGGGGKSSIKISKINVVQVVETTPEATAEVTPDPEVTPDSEETATPEATSEADDDMDTLIVIEGPVKEIHNNIITVFNFNIQVQENDPILLNLKIDDVIHVEGTSLVTGDTIIIVAINIVIIEINAPIIIQVPNPGANCRTTPGGKVKCSKRSHNR